MLISPGLGLLLPLGRFGALVWLVAAGAQLPLTRVPRGTDELGRAR